MKKAGSYTPGKKSLWLTGLAVCVMLLLVFAYIYFNTFANVLGEVAQVSETSLVMGISESEQPENVPDETPQASETAPVTLTPLLPTPVLQSEVSLNGLGDNGRQLAIDIALSDSIKNRQGNSFNSIRINPESTDATKSIYELIGTLEWANYLNHEGDISQEDYNKLDQTKKVVTISVPDPRKYPNGSGIAEQPDAWQDVQLISPNYKVVFVDKIYGKTRLLDSKKILSAEEFVNGVHAEVVGNTVRIYVIPDSPSLDGLAQDMVNRTKNKEAVLAITKALILVIGDSKLTDITTNKRNQYDASFTVERLEKEKYMAIGAVYPFWKAQGYSLYQSSVIATGDIPRFAIKSELDAKPWFLIDQ